jgi:3-dehydroquinate synthetase
MLSGLDCVYFTDSLPEFQPQDHDILIYDANLFEKLHSFILNFRHRLEIQSGETSKDISRLPEIISWINAQSIARPRFFALGGGSIGDLTGFIASIYKRGCPFVIMPTTWLSAMDSSHGGKNALNANGIKNSVGTFYNPEAIYISRAILEQLPPNFELDAWSELIKIGLIDSDELFLKFCNPDTPLWDLLPKAIDAKYKIVSQDPYEKKGIRRLLNLGHTLGHALESVLGFSHGKSVGYGLQFALHLSKKFGYLQSDLKIPKIPSFNELSQVLKASPPDILKNLKQDKKNEGSYCHFIFIRKPGDVFSSPILVTDLQKEILAIRNSS